MYAKDMKASDEKKGEIILDKPTRECSRMRRNGWMESLYHIIFILKPFLLLLLLASSQMEYLVAQTNTRTTYSKR